MAGTSARRHTCLKSIPLVGNVADGCSSVFVCDPFLEIYRRRLREAADMWLLGDCCRWIMKCTGRAESGQSLSWERIELCNDGKCQIRARKRGEEGRKEQDSE